MPPRGGGGGNKGRVPSSSLEKVCYLLLTSFSVVLLASTPTSLNISTLVLDNRVAIFVPD